MFICIVFFLTFKYACIHSRDITPEEEIELYLESLSRVPNFYAQNLNKIDIAAIFGLFITNANLKYLIRRPRRRLSWRNQGLMETIIGTNEEIIKTFSETKNQTLSPPYRQIATLFEDVTFWVNRLNTFTYTDQKRYSSYDLENKYSYTEKDKAVHHSEIGTPDQYTSNACLVSLSKYPTNYKDRILHCPLEKPCNEALKRGTNTGYSLSHRILWMVLSRYGRGCNIISNVEDERLKRNLCDMAFAEFQYHANHHFDHPDLMFEFICVCSLAGYSEHLHFDRLRGMLQFQMASGYFTMTANTDTGGCSNHITALSACSLSSALRNLYAPY